MEREPIASGLDLFLLSFNGASFTGRFTRCLFSSLGAALASHIACSLSLRSCMLFVEGINVGAVFEVFFVQSPSSFVLYSSMRRNKSWCSSRNADHKMIFAIHPKQTEVGHNIPQLVCSTISTLRCGFDIECLLRIRARFDEHAVCGLCGR